MKKYLLLGSAFAILAAPAMAADLPMKAPPTAAVVQTGGFYAWLDGSWQNVNLPRYNLGFVLQPPGGAITPGLSVDPEATGWGASGGLGVLLPTRLGTRDRFDVSGSFVHATDSRTGGSAISAGGVGGVMLSGVVATNIGCALGCSANGTLSSDYQNWQVSGRFATDYNMGSVILTPSVAVFGGNTHNDQALSETANFVGTVNFVVYGAQTALSWTDVGARAGLTATIPLTSSVSFGLGGTLGGVSRSVSLTGNDVNFLNASGAILFPSASAISTSASTTAFVANAEGSVSYMPWANWTLRAFGGVNFDNSVPGVAAPVATGNFTGTLPNPTATPASIKFESETSFYAGGGISVKF